MLTVTVDAFSGLPNPSWSVTDDAQVRDVLRSVARNRDAIAAPDAGRTGLGFRGVRIDLADDTLAGRYGLPDQFVVAGGGSANEARSVEVAEQLLAQMPVGTTALGADLELTSAVQDQLLEQLRAVPFDDELLEFTGPLGSTDPVTAAPGQESAGDVSAAVTCNYIATPFNPGFWNNDPYVRTHNNCYNYAVNRRTNTFAQPGRGCGHMYTRIDCAEVTRAALCDGAHRWGDCFPPGTPGTWVVALVMAPNFDYHWYRYSVEGFWGHKPGGTAARNTDNAGVVIRNPVTCSRAPYTQFCGYFQVASTMRIN